MKAKALVVRTSLLEKQMQQLAGGPRSMFVVVEYRGADGQIQGSYPVDDVQLAPSVGDAIDVTIETATDTQAAPDVLSSRI